MGIVGTGKGSGAGDWDGAAGVATVPAEGGGVINGAVRIG
jgi:hypothetical protein